MKTLFDNGNLLLDIWEGYYEARKNKRNTMNALDFEINVEHNIYQLYREISECRYEISPSICFIVNKPVKREIFAANFRDRVVHHYIINKLLPVFEKQFIYDCYSCRKGKGTLFGIKRMEHFMRSTTENYTKEAYVLKLDLTGFFMSIDRQLLLQKVKLLIEKKYQGYDKSILLYLVGVVILNDPTVKCRIKGNQSDWQGLPDRKSLFHSRPGCGLPIGNLTSQVFANYFLTDFDRYVKETLKLKCYGRYVDDFFVVHHDKQFLKNLVPVLGSCLKKTVGLNLHPQKTYLQSCVRGISYLGIIIKPHGHFLTNRIWRNVKELLLEIDDIKNIDLLYPEEKKRLQSRVNSYLGLQHHANVYKQLFGLRLFYTYGAFF